MTYSDRAKEAKKLRQVRIKELLKELRSCMCLYPLVVNRNGSGHDSACPVHLAYLKRKETSSGVD